MVDLKPQLRWKIKEDEWTDLSFSKATISIGISLHTIFLSTYCRRVKFLKCEMGIRRRLGIGFVDALGLGDVDARSFAGSG